MVAPIRLPLPRAGEGRGEGGSRRQEPVLSVRDLSVRFAGGIQAVRGISFDVFPDEVVCIVGESGSGKTVAALSLCGLLPEGAAVQGAINLAGIDVVSAAPEQLRRLRGQEIGFIFQDPATTLNPVLPIWRQIAEGQVAHGQIRAARCAQPGRRAAARLRHPRPGAPRRPIPAPILRRHAAARGDRHGARRPPAADHRRRADHRARRDRAGADPGDAGAEAGGEPGGGAADHARSRRGRGDRAPRAGHVCRAHRRIRPGRAHLPRPAPPLHARPAAQHAASPRREDAARPDPRPAAQPGHAAAGLRLPPALRDRKRPSGLRGGGSGC